MNTKAESSSNDFESRKKRSSWPPYCDPAFKRCRPEKLILDGRYTKLLAAFAKLMKLEHKIVWSKTNFGLGLAVSLFARTDLWDSALDVFERGKQGYVSTMSEYTQDALPSTPEDFSKKILSGVFGANRYIKAMKSGHGFVVSADRSALVPNPPYIIDDLPRSEEEFMLRLTLAGIDPNDCKIQLQKERK